VRWDEGNTGAETSVSGPDNADMARVDSECGSDVVFEGAQAMEILQGVVLLNALWWIPHPVDINLERQDDG
jgi:hypothetical protein